MVTRRGFLGRLASLIAAPAVARVMAVVPIVGPRVVAWAEFEVMLRRQYAETYESLAYGDNALMAMFRKADKGE